VKNMGGSHHLKRHPSPVYWPIHRKQNVWTVKPKAGSHPAEKCIPLLILIRNALNLAKTQREAKRIISERQIMVDGRFILEYDFPIGLMDVIEIPNLNVAYRVLPSQHEILILHKILEDEKTFKLLKITGKKTNKGGKIQLNLHDGQNLLIISEKTTKAEYKTTDVLKVSISKKKILDHVQVIKGVPAIVTGGKNIGLWGKVSNITEGKGSHPSIVTLDVKKEKKIQTPLENIFTIGKEKPWISLPEQA